MLWVWETEATWAASSRELSWDKNRIGNCIVIEGRFIEILKPTLALITRQNEIKKNFRKLISVFESNFSHEIYCCAHKKRGDKCRVEWKKRDRLLPGVAFQLFHRGERKKENKCRNNRNTFSITKTIFQPDSSPKQQKFNSVFESFTPALPLDMVEGCAGGGRWEGDCLPWANWTNILFSDCLPSPGFIIRLFKSSRNWFHIERRTQIDSFNWKD